MRKNGVVIIMNKFVRWLLILIAILGTTIPTLSAAAATTDDLTDADRETFLSNISLTLLSVEPEKDEIDCFDVSAEGLIAIGTRGSDGAKILVYNENGEFQYGYSFQAGQAFAVAWEEANLVIYFARSDIAAGFDRNGNNISLTSVETNTQYYDFWLDKIMSAQCVMNGKTYIARTGVGLLSFAATGYSQLAVIDSHGQESVLYDISAHYRVIVLLRIAAVLLFAAFVVWMIIRSISRHGKQNGQSAS